MLSILSPEQRSRRQTDPQTQARVTTALGHLRASGQPDRRRLCVAPRFDKPDPRGFLPRRFRVGSTILPSIPSPKHPQHSSDPPPRQTPGCATLPEQNNTRRRRPRPTPSCALCATAITLSVAARVRLLSSNPPVARTNQIAHRHTQCGQDNMHM